VNSYDLLIEGTTTFGNNKLAIEVKIKENGANLFDFGKYISILKKVLELGTYGFNYYDTCGYEYYLINFGDIF